MKKMNKLDQFEARNRKKAFTGKKDSMYTGFSRLKSRRLLLGFTQEQVALHAEISVRTYQAYEQGVRLPNIEVAIRISKILSSSCEYLWSTAEKDSALNHIESKWKKNP